METKREYQENMWEWISEKSYENLSDSIKDSYIIFCKWWAEKQKPVWSVNKWDKIPKKILMAWNFIQEEGYPNLYLVEVGFNKEIGLVSSNEHVVD